VALAESGQRVLAVSTDPAHSLGDALGRTLGPRPRPVPVRRGSLRAVELDADAALARWLGQRRERLATIVLRGTYLDREDVERFLSLSLPGTDELIGLLELSRLARAAPVDIVVVDTAPTGHTLRLLQMPEMLRQIASVLDDMQAKHRFLSRSLGGSYRGDSADALITEVEEEAAAILALLRDPERTTFSWVMLPEALSLEESRDGLAGLRRAGISVGEIVVNRVTPPPRGPCALCQGRRRSEAKVLAEAARAFRGIPLRVVAAQEDEPEGIDALRRFAPALRGRPARAPTARTASSAPGARPRGARRARRRHRGGFPISCRPRAAFSSSEERAAWARPPLPPPPLSRWRRTGRAGASCSSPRTPRIPWPTRSTCRSATTSERCRAHPRACAHASWTRTAR
jgi:arsenite-transporting ATPase